MGKSYLALLHEGNSMVKYAKKEINKIMEDARSAQNKAEFINTNKSKVITKLRTSLDQNSKERLQTSIEAMMSPRQKLQEYANSKAKDTTGTDKVFHLQNAVNFILNRGSIEQALEATDRLIKNLPAKEKHLKSIYLETLRERVAQDDPNSLFRVNEVEEKNLDAEEAVYFTQAKIAERLHDHHKIFEAMFTQQLKDLEELGDTTTEYDLDKIWEEVMQNAQSPGEVAPLTQDVQVNPYDESEESVAPAGGGS